MHDRCDGGQSLLFVLAMVVGLLLGRFSRHQTRVEVIGDSRYLLRTEVTLLEAGMEYWTEDVGAACCIHRQQTGIEGQKGMGVVYVVMLW